jgi:hypothetical protein
MVNMARTAWPVLFVGVAAFGCATEGNGLTDGSEEVIDARSDDAVFGDDVRSDRAPDGGEDFGDEVVPDIVPEGIPDDAPEVVGDVEDSVEVEEPLPNRCNRSGDRDCSPGPGGGYCPDGPSEFGRDVNAAIDATIAGHPEWFDTSVVGPGIHAENVNDYMQSVTDILYGGGLCASGPGEELGVKYNNDCSESWDIVATPSDTEWLVRRHYVGNCLPAFF